MKPRVTTFIFAIALSACAYLPAERPIALLGDPAPPASASTTIVIEPGTRWVNVTGGDIVNFVVGGKSFAWAFNVAKGVSSFELNRVAPPNMLDHRVDVYVAPDPRYIGGGGNERDGS
ncbi:hypothetical protein GCM10027343_31270 [Noviherbaspirillum agri]